MYTSALGKWGGTCKTPFIQLVSTARSKLTANSVTVGIDTGKEFQTEDAQTDWLNELTTDLKSVTTVAYYTPDGTDMFVNQGVYDVTAPDAATALSMLGASIALLASFAF